MAVVQPRSRPRKRRWEVIPSYGPVSAVSASALPNRVVPAHGDATRLGTCAASDGCHQVYAPPLHDIIPAGERRREIPTEPLSSRVLRRGSLAPHGCSVGKDN